MSAIDEAASVDGCERSEIFFFLFLKFRLLVYDSFISEPIKRPRVNEPNYLLLEKFVLKQISHRKSIRKI